MVQSCCAIYCKERSSRGSGVSFHSFPQDEKVKEQWVRAVCRFNFKPLKHSRLCSKHFSANDFVTNGWSSKRVLKKDAVPNTVKKNPIDENNECEALYIEYSPEIAISNENNTKQTTINAKNVKIIVALDSDPSLKDKINSLIKETKNNTNNKINSDNEVLESSSLLLPAEEVDKIFSSAQNLNCKKTDDPENLTTEDKNAVAVPRSQDNDVGNATTTINETNECIRKQNGTERNLRNLNRENGNFQCENSLCRKKIHEELKHYNASQKYTNKLQERLMEKKKQVKALQQRNRRLNRRVNKLNTLIGKQLKLRNNEIKADSHQITNMLKSLTPTGRVIIKEMIKTKRSKVYPAELKNFALTLNFYSPRSYLYVKKIFPPMLPHPRTLLKWS